MFGFKNHLRQTLYWPLIFVCIHLLVKRFIIRFYYKITYLGQLERLQLWLNFCYDQLAYKIVYYKQVKVTINTFGFAKIILNIIIWLHKIVNLIVTHKKLFFTFKFWSLLFYFFGIKQKLFTSFQPQTNN